jgi:hypothetical protein
VTSGGTPIQEGREDTEFGNVGSSRESGARDGGSEEPSSLGASVHSETLVVDLSDLDKSSLPRSHKAHRDGVWYRNVQGYFDRDKHKEVTASKVAMRIVGLFGVSLALSLLVVIGLIWMVIAMPDEMVSEVIPVVNALLEVVKVVAAVFSPLLAFILGYYFSLSAMQKRGLRDDE